MKKMLAVMLCSLTVLVVLSTSPSAHAGDKFRAVTSQVTDGGSWTVPFCPGANKQIDTACENAAGWCYLTHNAPNDSTTKVQAFCPRQYRSLGSPLKTGMLVMDAGQGIYPVLTGPDNCITLNALNPDGGDAVDPTVVPRCIFFEWQPTNASVRVSP